MRRILPRPTYANVMATIAVVMSMAGTSYAAVILTGANIKDGTLTSADVKDGSLRGSDVANGSLNGSKIADGSVSSSDIADGTLTGTDIKPDTITHAALGAGAVDSTNLADSSITLTDLAPSTRAALTIDTVRQDVDMVPSDLTIGYPTKTVDITCPTGEHAIGGGAYSPYWIQYAKDHGDARYAGIGANATGVPDLDANGQPTGWTVTLYTFTHQYGIYNIAETPDPPASYVASDYPNSTAYALCAA